MVGQLNYRSFQLFSIRCFDLDKIVFWLMRRMLIIKIIEIINHLVKSKFGYGLTMTNLILGDNISVSFTNASGFNKF